MHRDFQSRNLLVKEGALRVIDFQTAHRGPWAYDAASLLKDPYHLLDDGTRTALLGYLHERLVEGGAAVPSDRDAFRDAFTAAGIQRNMQALAAFARLGGRLGKERFIEFIPPCLGLLEDGLDETGRFPAIGDLVRVVRERIQGGKT